MQRGRGSGRAAISQLWWLNSGGKVGGAIRGARNNILLILSCSALRPLLHPVNLSDSAISPRAAAINLIFSLELTHDFIVPALAAVQEEPASLFRAALLFLFVQSCKCERNRFPNFYSESFCVQPATKTSVLLHLCVCNVWNPGGEGL